MSVRIAQPHPQARDLQVVVVLVGDLDQLAEDRVVEGFPPPDLLRRIPRDNGTVGLPLNNFGITGVMKR
jgi:hypothetical protein